MKFELVKADILHMVLGCDPSFIEDHTYMQYGHYISAHGTLIWSWYEALLTLLTEEELLDLYNRCTKDKIKR
jgi:hypothetical protein